MTIGRLAGGNAIDRLGHRRLLLIGSVIAIAGFAAAALVPISWVAFAGFAMVGLGTANVVPILFTAAGAQDAMPSAMAVTATTTIAYAGILLGPAIIGLVAHHASFQASFLLVGAGMAIVAVFAPRVVRPNAA